MKRNPKWIGQSPALGLGRIRNALLANSEEGAGERRHREVGDPHWGRHSPNPPSHAHNLEENSKLIICGAQKLWLSSQAELAEPRICYSHSSFWMTSHSTYKLPGAEYYAHAGVPLSVRGRYRRLLKSNCFHLMLLLQSSP